VWLAIVAYMIQPVANTTQHVAACGVSDNCPRSGGGDPSNSAGRSSVLFISLIVASLAVVCVLTALLTCLARCVCPCFVSDGPSRSTAVSCPHYIRCLPVPATGADIFECELHPSLKALRQTRATFQQDLVFLRSILAAR
jgi:hypothetical protein